MTPEFTGGPDAAGNAARSAGPDSKAPIDPSSHDGFAAILQLAALLLDVPVALASAIDGDRRHVLARWNGSPDGTGLEDALWPHTRATPGLLVIPDVWADPRTREEAHAAVGPGVRFYAGAAFHGPDGAVLGMLEVFGHTARPAGLTEQQAQALHGLARQAGTVLALHRALTGRDGQVASRRRAEQLLGEDHARLRISEAHWRGLFERLNEGLIIAELVRDAAGQVIDWRYLEVNPAWSELLGRDRAQVVGRTIRDVFPGIDRQLIADVARVVESGEPSTFKRRVGTLDRWYEGRTFPLDGDRFAVLFLEVTERVGAEIRRNALLEIGDKLRDLATVEAMTRITAAIVGEALGVTRAGFGRLDAGGTALEIEPDWTAPGIPSIAGRHYFADYGDVRNELLSGEPLIICDAHTDSRTANDRARWHGLQIRALVNIPIQERGRTVAVFLVHDAKPRQWPAEVIAFLRSVADRLTAGVARLKAEHDQQLLNDELSHRMKNMLAMIQAIATQTLKRVTEQDAVASFQQRLLALSSAHDVLLQKSWAPAPMREVVQTVLRATSQMERFAISGPEVTLGPRATLSLSLLLHEMATNAAKYGALSAEAGRVAVAWYVDTQANDLVFSWRETGGPDVVPPARTGFGSRLIRSGLMGTGNVSLRYLPTGLDAVMRAGLEQVQST